MNKYLRKGARNICQCIGGGGGGGGGVEISVTESIVPSEDFYY